MPPTAETTNSPVTDSAESRARTHARGLNGSENGPKVLIIGAGMSGILLVIKLREAGFSNVTVYEKGSTPGGTWRDNTYPGLKCDIPAHMFTYSFEPNPDYSTRFPSGSEIKEYLDRVYRKYDVESAVQFDKSVVTCDWNIDHWDVTTADGLVATFDVVITATGILHTPYYPSISGRESFAGESFHTARWNHKANLSGKRVGVIGTGSTAAQIVPELVERVGTLVLFQRTPQWIFPMPNKRYTAEEMAKVRRSPALAKRLRFIYSKIFQWTFTRAVIGNSLLQKGIEFMCESHLKRKVADPALREKLRPTTRAGCKRLIFGKGFYQALQKPNANLVIDPIDRIEERGVVTSDGVLHELDVLVYSTGFQAHNYMRPIQVTGRDGLRLDDAWAEGAYAHRSTSIPGFPNFFTIFGPYSPIGNYSAISVAETQCAYILKQLASLQNRKMDIIESDQQATHQLWDSMKVALKKTIWMSGCDSWYMDTSGNIPMWPWTFERFAKDLSKLKESEFIYSKRTSNPLG